MKTYDFREFIRNARSLISAHELEPGHYRRWTLKEDDDGSVNPYGCADACNILYSIGDFPKDQASRAANVHALQSLQDPETGMFVESTHHTIHTTAHCAAAIELFDQKALYPLRGLEQWSDPSQIGPFLEQLDWTNPWNQSHQGAGIYAARILQDEASDEWQAAYFEWLWDNACPTTGYWRKGDSTISPATEDYRGIFPYLAGAFHYLFNLQHARQPLRYPEAMIDTGLKIFNEELFPPLYTGIAFAQIDWVYCQSRALRQCGHRFEESIAAIRAFAERYLTDLLSRDFKTDKGLDDLHALFGCICCIAELQQTLPGTILTDKPLKLVLDRRPFI